MFVLGYISFKACVSMLLKGNIIAKLTPRRIYSLIICTIFVADLVKSLTSALARYTQDVSSVIGNPDRREPEFVLYDTASATMNVYR